MHRHLLQTTDGTPTGTAQIWVDGEGQNSIVIVAGANGALTPEDVRRAEEEHHVISNAKVLMVSIFGRMCMCMCVLDDEARKKTFDVKIICIISTHTCNTVPARGTSRDDIGSA
jgi:sugar/nucleoside kinase (ribokinase family)